VFSFHVFIPCECLFMNCLVVCDCTVGVNGELVCFVGAIRIVKPEITHIGSTSQQSP